LLLLPTINPDIHKTANDSGRAPFDVTLIGHTRRNHVFDRIRTMLGGAPCRVQVAALPWRIGAGGVEIMLITSRDTGRWVVPKGWPEGGETLWDAAAREAGEEAGIGGSVAPREIGRFYYAKQLSSGGERRCVVHVFPREIDAVREKWRERKQRRREWVSPAQAASRVREPDLAELIEAFAADPRNYAA
jgi:8-oxo-dGTP pyrophosphatase MutT (NUDIX family)